MRIECELSARTRVVIRLQPSCKNGYENTARSMVLLSQRGSIDAAAISTLPPP